MIKLILAIIASTALSPSFFGEVVAEPTWNTADPIFNCNPGTGIAAKDPSIIFSNGSYHMFYTVHITPSRTDIFYATAPKLRDLNGAVKTRVMGGAAPQVFTHDGIWYMIHNGVNFSTNEKLGPSGWKFNGPLCKNVPKSKNGPIDPWVICDEEKAYLFYSRDDGTLNMTWEPLSDFPNQDKWSTHVVAIDQRPNLNNIFEAGHIYRSRADKQYYLQIEGLGGAKGRKLALFTTGKLDQEWRLVSNNWASKDNLRFPNGNKWSDCVSHPEAIRANATMTMEINDINESTWIFMGVTGPDMGKAFKSGGGYGGIPWQLGLMWNGNRAEE